MNYKKEPTKEEAEELKSAFALRHPEIFNRLDKGIEINGSHFSAYKPQDMDAQTFGILYRFANDWYGKKDIIYPERDFIMIPEHEKNSDKIMYTDSIENIRESEDNLRVIIYKDDSGNMKQFFTEMSLERLKTLVYIF